MTASTRGFRRDEPGRRPRPPTGRPQRRGRGTRRAPRFRMRDDTDAQVDGGAATLIDVSAMGAQIISKAALKPQQRLRIVLADDLGIVRFSAAVAWASFEIPKGVTRYRAGIEFQDAEAEAVEAFAKRH